MLHPPTKYETGPLSERSTHDFEDYRRTGDPRLRDRLVEAHVGLAYSIARQFEGHGEERDDLRQVALMALLHAVDRFDPARGAAFSTFATPTITGTLKRHLRDRTWLVRPPRSLNDRVLAAAKAEEHLTNTLGRAPTSEEVAREGGWTPREVEEARTVRRTYRLNDRREIDEVEVRRIPAVSDESDTADDRVVLEELVGKLDTAHRQAVKLRYFADLTQIEIGRRLGVSQMQVSRMLAQSSADLRALADSACAIS